MRRRAEQAEAFVLHQYAWKETSLIVEVFSREHGRVALLARGARRPRSAMRGLLLAFRPLRLNWSRGTELGTLTAVEWAGGMQALAGTGLMCGFYLNELLLRLLPRDDPHEALYDAYAAGLAALSTGTSQGTVLRSFERRLLAEVGYALQLEHDVQSGAPIDPSLRYLYEPERGPVAANGAAPPGREACRVEGRTLLDMAQDDYADGRTREESRGLMRALITERLGGQVLHTRAILMELQDL